VLAFGHNQTSVLQVSGFGIWNMGFADT